MVAASQGLFGISSHDDIKEETTHYQLGSDGNMPIALFLSLMSNNSQAVARLLNIVVSSHIANQTQVPLAKKDVMAWAQMFNRQELATQADEAWWQGQVKDVPLNEFTVEQRQERTLDFTPDYEQVMPLGNYVEMWTIFLTMATARYNSGYEAVVMACSPSYVKFHNRAEFCTPYDEVFKTLRHIILDVQRIMKLQGFEVDEDNHTFACPIYKAVKFQQYFGF